MVLSMLHTQSLPFWINGATAVNVLIFASNMHLDSCAAIPLGVLHIGISAAMVPLLSAWSCWGIISAAAAMQLLSWMALTKCGHQVLEPPLQTKGRRQEDSNMYFRRGYCVARDLGVRASRC